MALSAAPPVGVTVKILSPIFARPGDIARRTFGASALNLDQSDQLSGARADLVACQALSERPHNPNALLSPKRGGLGFIYIVPKTSQDQQQAGFIEPSRREVGPQVMKSKMPKHVETCICRHVHLCAPLARPLLAHAQVV